MTGSTGSTDLAMVNAYQATCAGSGCSSGDAYLLKLNATASAILYSSYLGGSQAEDGTSVAIDPQGNAYLTGYSLSTNFPSTPDAFRTTVSGFGDAFVTKLNTSASGTASLVWSTLFGGNDDDQARAIALDSAGNAYITGDTLSSNLATPGAAQTSYSGSQTAAFVAKIGVQARRLGYSYDGLQRLIGASELPGNAYAYTYDLAGNRTSVQVNGGTPAITTYNEANQITNAGYSYDNAGNLIGDGTASYSYDALSRMTVRGSTTYTYNGDGTLVKQVATGAADHLFRYATDHWQRVNVPFIWCRILQVDATDALWAAPREGLWRTADGHDWEAVPLPWPHPFIEQFWIVGPDECWMTVHRHDTPPV